MRVNFGELRIGELARKNLNQVMDTHWASEGPLVEQLEKEWSQHFGYAHSVSMSSGTDACINACLALYEFKAVHGDEIICPALTFVATVNAIVLAGFTPKFVDIRRDTLNIDPGKIEEAITSKTIAIVVTHTMGKPCQMDAIMDIARRYNLLVIEDACEAHGAKFDGTYVGKIGHIATFSFYAAHLICAGEGGMCSTDYSDIADVLRSTRSHGRKPGTNYFDFLRVGMNSKMNDLEAAIGLEGLSNFDETIWIRTEYRDMMLSLLSDLGKYLFLYQQGEDEFISPHAFPILLKTDNEEECKSLYRFLESQSIQCKTLFGSIPTQQAAYEFLNYRMGQFPEAEYVGRNGLHFGLHQYLTKQDIRYISDKIHEFFRGK